MTKGSLSDASPELSDPHVLLAGAQTALRESREREAALRRELEHRVKNALAITRSVVSRTMETATSLEDAQEHLSGRLGALARYHGWLAAMPGSTFDLEAMIRDEMLVFGSGSDPRIVVTGPDVRLTPRIAEAIGLALHELATNSVKFGVLSYPASDGRLRIEWQQNDGKIEFAWVETGVPIVASAPIGSGFGRDFIEQGLPYQIDAETHFMLLPGGLDCRITFPSGVDDCGEPNRAQVVDLS